MQARLTQLRNDLVDCATAHGRDANAVDILAVTKSIGPQRALELARLGVTEMGENRLEGLTEKATYFAEHEQPVRWHFLGHLQRNKLRKILEHAQVLHSVDRLAVIESLARLAQELERKVQIYLQVNLDPEGGDSGRSGFGPKEVAQAVELAADRSKNPHAPGSVELLGLMAMAPLPAPTAAPAQSGSEAHGPQAAEQSSNQALSGHPGSPGDGPGSASNAPQAQTARESFNELAALARTLPPELFPKGGPRLSMGMSGDWREAVAAGSHVIRIGRALVQPT